MWKQEKEQKKIYEATKVAQQNKKTQIFLFTLISQSHKYFRYIHCSYHQNVCVQLTFVP